jgi:uncharacterized protein YcbK (DUF882 family)
MHSKYFKRSEIRCKCGECVFESFDTELLEVLTDVREHFNRPIVITSGNRCEAHNFNIGGSKKSKHMAGIAADIIVRDIAPKEVYKHLDNKYTFKYGLGLYKKFVHIDVRESKARW